MQCRMPEGRSFRFVALFFCPDVVKWTKTGDSWKLTFME